MKRILVGALFLAACCTALAAPGEPLGSGDSVHVSVFQHPELAADARIGDRGTLQLPLLGEVKVGGLSAQEAARRIAAAYRKGGFLIHPEVTVALTTVRSRQVSVLGEVVHPGRYVIEGPSARLTDVIALAGGIAPTGSDMVTVVEERDGKPVKSQVDLPKMMESGRLGKDFTVHGGETIYVPRAPVFYIYGEVTRAGAYRLEPGMTVMQALSVGGGITARGSDRRIELRRPTGNGKFSEHAAGLQDRVQADDVIYVRESIF